MNRLQLDPMSANAVKKMNGFATYVVLGQQVKRAEDFVVVELKALGGLEHPLVVGVCRHLRDFLGAPLGLVLPVRILR